MALSNDLRKRAVEAVVSGGLSRNAAAKRLEVGIASAVRWVEIGARSNGFARVRAERGTKLAFTDLAPKLGGND